MSMKSSEFDLGDILFGQYRRRVLGLLLLHPEKSFHVREIARITGLPSGTIHRELARLAHVGLLYRQQVGNQVRYRANPNSVIFDELRSILRKTVGIADILREVLLPLKERIQFAFVFGSVARGKEHATSDIDLMLVGEISFLEAIHALHSTQDTLRREINPKVYSPSEFQQKCAATDPFLLHVLNEPKLMIFGDSDDLTKSCQSRQPATVHSNEAGNHPPAGNRAGEVE